MTADESAPSLVRKLGLRHGHRLALVGAPPKWHVPDLPGGVRQRRAKVVDKADVIIAFFSEAGSLNNAVATLGRAVFPDGALWVAWPRRAGGHQSDVTERLVRAAALPHGLVDVKVAALDHDWSGLKLVWRKERRGSFGGL